MQPTSVQLTHVDMVVCMMRRVGGAAHACAHTDACLLACTHARTHDHDHLVAVREAGLQEGPGPLHIQQPPGLLLQQVEQANRGKLGVDGAAGRCCQPLQLLLHGVWEELLQALFTPASRKVGLEVRWGAPEAVLPDRNTQHTPS